MLLHFCSLNYVVLVPVFDSSSGLMLQLAQMCMLNSGGLVGGSVLRCLGVWQISAGGLVFKSAQMLGSAGGLMLSWPVLSASGTSDAYTNALLFCASIMLIFLSGY